MTLAFIHTGLRQMYKQTQATKQKEGKELWEGSEKAEIIPIQSCYLTDMGWLRSLKSNAVRTE